MTLAHASKSCRRPVLRLCAAVGVVLQGCAGAPLRPKIGPPSVPAPAPVAAPEPVVTMAPIPNPEPARPSHSTHTSSTHHATKASEGGEAKPVAHPAPEVDHAKAAHLRTLGLEELDRGAINKAVDLLQAAAQLDPDNALIKRDLERALRIRQAVHARH